MTFSAEAWARNLALYETTRDMAFNRELAAGSLPISVFRHYIVQDAHYLVAFAQALAVAAAKSDAPELVAQFSHAAAAAIEVERALHADYFERFGLSAEVEAATAPSPTCHHYASFLIATAFREPLPVLLAAVLPCFWVYREVGRHLLALTIEANPYQAWIDTYGGADFAAAVDRMIAATDAAADEAGPATVSAMHRAYARAAQLEWMFWDSATRLETWPV
jgi:thiaminase (transcriptional activator TenA)